MRRVNPAAAIFAGLLVVAIVLLALGRVFAGGALLALVLLTFAGVGVGSGWGTWSTSDRMDEVFRGQVGSGARFDPSESAVYDEHAWEDARAERGEQPEIERP